MNLVSNHHKDNLGFYFLALAANMLILFMFFSK